MSKFRYSLNGGSSWTVISAALPYNIPSAATDDVMVEPIGAAVTDEGEESSLPAAVKVVGEGDSITAGNGNPVSPNRWIDVAVGLMPAGPTYTVGVVATNGQYMYNCFNEFSTRLGPAYDPTKFCIAHLMAGYNDAPGTDAQTLLIYLRRLAARSFARGYDRVVVGTLISVNHGDPPNAEYAGGTLQYNIDMKALASEWGVSAVSDFGANPYFDTVADTANLTYYNADALHPTQAGHAIMGTVAGPTLTTALEATSLPAVVPGWSIFDGWNGSTAMSNSRRTITGQSSVCGAMFKHEGKWAWETVLGSTHGACVGVVAEQFTSWDGAAFSALSPYGVGSYDGTILKNNVLQGDMGAYANGNVIQHHLDADNKRYWLRKAGGNWNGNGSANPATNTGGIDISDLGMTFTPHAQIGGGGTGNITGNFTTAQLANAPASGFLPIGG